VATDEIYEICAGEDAFEEFRLAMGERLEPFITPAVAEENMKVIAHWAVEHISGGLSAARNLGWWDISFRNALAAGLLVKDPSWKPWATRRAELRLEDASMPAAEFKERYATDPEFKRYIDEEKQ
jgi:hypothetical protein